MADVDEPAALHSGVLHRCDYACRNDIAAAKLDGRESPRADLAVDREIGYAERSSNFRDGQEPQRRPLPSWSCHDRLNPSVRAGPELSAIALLSASCPTLSVLSIR